MDALREWIRAAEAARATCLNVPEFDMLIRHQKQRLEAGARKAAIGGGRGQSADATSSHKERAMSNVSHKEVTVFSNHCALIRSVYRFSPCVFLRTELLPKMP